MTSSEPVGPPASTAPAAGPIFPVRSWLLLMALVTVAAVGFGYTLGSSKASPRVEAVECVSTSRQIGCTMADGWGVGVPLDVSWSDSEMRYSGSRPSCLPKRGSTDTVSVAWMPVEVDGSKWREVVHVYC